MTVYVISSHSEINALSLKFHVSSVTTRIKLADYRSFNFKEPLKTLDSFDWVGHWLVFPWMTLQSMLKGVRWGPVPHNEWCNNGGTMYPCEKKIFNFWNGTTMKLPLSVRCHWPKMPGKLGETGGRWEKMFKSWPLKIVPCPPPHHLRLFFLHFSVELQQHE